MLLASEFPAGHDIETEDENTQGISIVLIDPTKTDPNEVILSTAKRYIGSSGSYFS